jgi:hypothetical protein
MAFLLSAEREAEDYLTSNSWQRYLAYLEVHRSAIPCGAFAIATAPWWYSFDDPKAPHDSGLDRIEMGDVTSDEQENGTFIWIRIHLCSAHSGRIRLFYPRVYSYSLQMMDEEYPLHGDWRFDEFSSDGTRGRFTHTIEWADGPTWRITACELIHEFEP